MFAAAVSALLVLASSAVAVPGSTPRPEQAHTSGRSRVIPLDPSKDIEELIIHASTQVKTDIYFPEPWVGVPKCGDCFFVGQQQTGSQRWMIQLFPESNSLTLNAAVAPNAERPQAGYESNLNVMLKSGLIVSFRIFLVPPNQAEDTIKLTLPKGSTAEAILATERSELEKEFTNKLEDGIKTGMLKAFMTAPVKCRDFLGGPTRKDGMVLRLKQICRNGAFTFMAFEVENRHAQPEIKLGSASLVDREGNESTRVLFAKDTVKFNEKVLGIVAIEASSSSAPASLYTLAVGEEGGRERVVVLKDIEF